MGWEGRAPRDPRQDVRWLISGAARLIVYAFRRAISDRKSFACLSSFLRGTLDQKAEDENDDEDENDWGGRKQEKPHSKNHLFTYSLLICYRFSMESLFDYEKLDVYRVELAFIAWIADFLGDVAQSWVLVPVLRFPNRSRRRRRSRLRPLCISKGWSLRLRSSFHGHATPCDAGRAGVHLPSEPVHPT
jgi:hypothetical protein